MARRHYSNLAPAVMTSGSLTPSATSVSVTSVTGFPSVPFTATLERGTASEELVLVTATVGTSLTLTRAYGGTTGKTHNTGVAFEHTVDATDSDEANNHVNANAGVHGAVGSVVGTTDAQTISNKTLSASKGQASTTDPALLTLAAASGTQPHLIGKDSTNTTTEYTVAKGGAATFTAVTTAGALTGATAAVSGAAAVGSLTTGGVVTATGTVTGGNLTTGGGVTATGTVKASNMGGRLGRSATDGTTVTSSGTTEVVSSVQRAFSLVNGRRYRCYVNSIVNAPVDGVSTVVTLRASTGTVNNGSTQVVSTQQMVTNQGGTGQTTFQGWDEFVATSTATWNFAAGIAARVGTASPSLVGWYMIIDDVGV